MILEFVQEPIARLCNSEDALDRWAGEGSSVLKRLLYELAAAETLGVFAQLPFASVYLGPTGRAAAHNERAGVLLEPQPRDTAPMTAKRAQILAVSIDSTALNPKGAKWPKRAALSPTTP